MGRNGGIVAVDSAKQLIATGSVEPVRLPSDMNDNPVGDTEVLLLVIP